MPRMRTLKTASLVVVLAITCHLPAKDTNPWTAIVHSPLERDGEYDRLASTWLEMIATGPAGPPAELLLRRLGKIAGDLVAPGALVEPLERFVCKDLLPGRSLHLARDLLARLYRRAGRWDDVDALDPDREYLRHWIVIGPFGTGAPSQLSQPFAPETDLALDREYAGLRRQLRWQHVNRLRPHRRLHARHVLASGPGIHYHLAQVHVSERVEVLLHLGAAAPLRVFIDRATVIEESHDLFLATPRSYPAILQRGWNRILVKSAGDSFSLRLTDRTAAALDDQQVRVETAFVLHAGGPPHVQAANASPTPPTGEDPRTDPPLASPPEALSTAAESGDELLGSALLRRLVGRHDLAVDAIEHALETLPESPHAHYHAGRVFRAAAHLPAEPRRRRARAAFDRALELDADFLPARVELARFLLRDDEPLRAAAAVERALERNPRYLPALALRLEIFQKQNWDTEAADAANAIETVSPVSPLPHVFRGELASSLGNLGDAVRHFGLASEHARHRMHFLERLASLESRRGNATLARSHLEAWHARRPDSFTATSALAQFLLDHAESGKAIELLQERATRFPADRRGLRRLAATRQRAGQTEEAHRSYQQLVSMDPGDLDSMRYLDHLDGKPFDRFWEAFDEKLEEWMPRIPGREQFPKAASLAVLDVAVIKIYPDGSSSEYTHQALQLLDEAAKEQIASVATAGEIIRLRTVTPAGESLQPASATGKNRWVMPGLEPGVIVEFAYRRDVADFDGWLFRKGAFFFQDFSYRQPMLLSRYVVIVPADFPADIVERALHHTGDDRFAAVTRKERELDNGWRAIIYEARDVQRLEPEVAMPSRAEYVPSVALIEKRDWLDVASVLENTVLGKSRLTPPLRRFANACINEIEDPLARARVLHAKIAERIRTDTGPDDAVGVFLESGGNRDVLYRALLDAAGVPCRWAFARRHEDMAPVADFGHPEPGIFPRRFLLIEPPDRKPVWTTLTARHAPFGKLPDGYPGGRALVIGHGAPEIIPIPEGPGESPANATRLEIGLGAGDDMLAARIHLTTVLEAYRYFNQKSRLENLDDHRQDLILRSLASQMFPGARVEKGSLPGVKTLGEPLAFDIELVAPRFLQEAGEEFLMRPVTPPFTMVRNYIRIPVRTHPYHLQSRVVKRDRMRIDPGDRLRFVRLPGSTVQLCPIGSYSLRYMLEDGVLRIERELTLGPGKLAIEEFPQFLEFCKSIDSAETQRVVLARALAHGSD